MSCPDSAFAGCMTTAACQANCEPRERSGERSILRTGGGMDTSESGEAEEHLPYAPNPETGHFSSRAVR